MTNEEVMEMVQNAKTKNLVEFFNINTDRNIKKFATRAVAERRVVDLLDEMWGEGIAAQRFELLSPEDDDEAALETEEAAPKKEVGKLEFPESSSRRSQGIARSWTIPEVAAKRAQRSAVKVDGVWYKSVAEAFRALELPMKMHIAFRMDLKAADELEAFGHNWEIVPLNYE